MERRRKTDRIGDDAVRARTGKDWAEWFALLDAAGAAKMSHQEIVACVSQIADIGMWWQQSVTVTYEQARGLRELYQTTGGYQVSVSKTIAVPVSKLYEAWMDEAIRSQWLPGAKFNVRKATPGKSLRITWLDGGTDVDVNLYSRGEAKSQITVQHAKLADAKDVARMREHWAEALEQLKTTIGA